jgi:hypothetical protein
MNNISEEIRMKSFPLTLVAISLICILSVGAVSALISDDVSVITSWASPKYYQGDTAAVSITLQSNIDDTLTITRVSIQFDWMPPDAYYSHDLSASPVSIPGHGSYAFELTNILLVGASAGSHDYKITIDGLQDSVEFIWDSPSFTIYIYSGNEKTYYTLEPQVKAKIDNATFTNSEAQSLLQKATAEYDNALTAAANGDWQEAVTSLQSASDYVDQAKAAEQRGGGPTSNLLLFFAIAAIVVVIFLAVVAVAVRRKRKPPEMSDSVEPVEPVE